METEGLTPCPKCNRALKDGKHIDTQMGEKCENTKLKNREKCPWTYERWDGVWVKCTLKKDHTPLDKWPFHAPNKPVMKPWKQTVTTQGKYTE